MKRAFYIVLTLFLSLAMACSGLLIHALYFEVPFLSYENLPFPAQLAIVRPGDVMPLLVRRCNSSNVAHFYDITHELVNLDRPQDPPLILKSERVKIDPGCHEGVSTINLVPANALPGKYMAAGLGIVEGSVRTFTVPWYSQPFQVIN